MNIEHLRKSLKVQWLNYYRDNRDWLTRLGVWVTCDDKRRPSSSFILATLSVLEPKLTQLLPLVVDLSSNPDRIVMALGLNFNPDEELKTLEDESAISNGRVKLLPEGLPVVEVTASNRQVAAIRTSAPPSKDAFTASVVEPVAIPSQTQRSPAPSAPSSPPSSVASPKPIFEPPDQMFEATETQASSETPQTSSDSDTPRSTAQVKPQHQSPRVMDTAELAVGELPEREVKQADEACEGVNSAVRTRWD